MIRDEFKNDTKKQTEQKIKNKKEASHDRAFYAKKISTYSELFGPVKFSTITCLVCFILAGGMYVLTRIISPETEKSVLGIICVVLAALLIVWAIAWFAIIAPMLRKKVVEYKQKLAEFNASYVQRYKK